jgi:large subunit ribosomal protein L21
MFAVIKSGGRQYKVSVGQHLRVNRLAVEDGSQIRFDEVLLITDADRSFIGTPFVDQAEVLATVVKQARGEKLYVFKYKSKKRYRHRHGHRQELTVLSIDDIIAEGKSLITGEAPKVKEIPATPVEKAEQELTVPTVDESVAQNESPITDVTPEAKEVPSAFAQDADQESTAPTVDESITEDETPITGEAPEVQEIPTASVQETAAVEEEQIESSVEE